MKDKDNEVVVKEDPNVALAVNAAENPDPPPQQPHHPGQAPEHEVQEAAENFAIEGEVKTGESNQLNAAVEVVVAPEAKYAEEAKGDAAEMHAVKEEAAAVPPEVVAEAAVADARPKVNGLPTSFILNATLNAHSVIIIRPSRCPSSISN